MCKKPPLGLRPKFICNKDRAIEILDAMYRYINSDLNIPIEWIDELRSLKIKNGLCVDCKAYYRINTSGYYGRCIATNSIVNGHTSNKECFI